MRPIKILYVGAIAVVAFGFSCKFIQSDNLNQAIARGDMRSVQKHLDKGIDVNGRGMHAMTPLMKAAETGRLDFCELLIKYGADVNGHNDSGSVLMWAVNSGNEELVRFLLASGADKSWVNALGDDAHSLATKRGFTNLAEILKADAEKSGALNQ